MLRKIMNVVDFVFPLLLFSPFIIALFVLASGRFGGRGDWYYSFPNEYEMSRANSKSISIRLTEADNTERTIIPTNIVAFWHDKRYVCVQTVEPEDTKPFREGKTVNVHYYFLDTMNNQLIGPISEEESFRKEVKDEFGITEINYIATAPKPENAKYYMD